MKVHFTRDLQTDQHRTLKSSYKRCLSVKQKVIDKYEETLESKWQSIPFCSVALLIKTLLILSEFNKQILISGSRLTLIKMVVYFRVVRFMSHFE